jgi:hypothetical protein
MAEMLPEPVELSDAELNLVTGGHLAHGHLVHGGLVNVVLSDVNVEILTDGGLIVNVDDSIKDIANNNNVSVGAIIQLLGGGAGILQNQV